MLVGGEWISCTPQHPFYSPIKGWTAAAQLRAGDILLQLNGEYVVVEIVLHELLEQSVLVYNFNVNNYHTYFVAKNELLVHNSCNHNGAWNNERRHYWKNMADNVVEDYWYGPYQATPYNIDRMSKGLAPIGWDDLSVQLHHPNGILNDFYNYEPVSATYHRLIHSKLK